MIKVYYEELIVLCLGIGFIPTSVSEYLGEDCSVLYCDLIANILDSRTKEIG